MIGTTILSLVLGLAMLGTISQTAADVRGRTRQGKPGQWCERSSVDEYFTGLNQSPQAVQVTTVTVADPGDDTDVTITINGVDVTFNTGTGLDAAGVCSGLADAINAEPLVRGQVAASANATTLTLTGLTPGLAFTVAEADAALSSVTTTTSADEADPIPFGRALVSQGYQTGEPERLVALAASARFTAQVVTVTPTFVSGAKLTVAVYEIRGDERHLLASVTETSATDLATTLAALVASLNAALPANSVLAAENDTAMTLTAEIPGLEFAVDVSAGDEGASVPTIAVANTTGPSAATSIHRALAGISLYSHVDPAPSGSNDGEYAGNAGVLVASRGKLFVANSEAVTEGGTVYVELGVAADNGKLFASGSATRVALPRSRVQWARSGYTASDGVAVVRLAL